MESARGTIVLACVAFYLLACVAIGLWALRRTHDTRDFFVAGRNLGALVTAVALFSSIMSGFGFVGGPGLVYGMGTSSIWMTIPVTIGVGLSTFLLGKRLRLLAELRDSVSLPDLIAARYRSETSRLLSALAILLGVVGYLAAQILAMATVLQEILIRSGFLGEISLELCMVLSITVLVFYCVTGGIIASVYTDLVQGSIMVVAAVLVCVVALGSVEGGLTGISQTLRADDPESISPWGTLGILGCLSWYFLFAVGGMGQPHAITKLMMYRRIQDVKSIALISVVGYGLLSLLWISVGLAMRALVLQGEHPTLENWDQAAPRFLWTYAPPMLAGVVFAGLFSAIMSTADAFLNIGAAAVVHDIPRALRGRSLRRELLWARTATVGLAVLAALFALYTQDLVGLLGAFGWATFAGVFVPSVALGFNWKRGTARAANAAMLSSLALNLAVKLLDLRLPYGVDAGAVSLLVAMALFLGISLSSPPPALDQDIEAVMEL